MTEKRRELSLGKSSEGSTPKFKKRSIESRNSLKGPIFIHQNVGTELSSAEDRVRQPSEPVSARAKDQEIQFSEILTR